MEYHLNEVKVAEVQDEANQVLSALRTDDRLRTEARDRGVDLAQLDAALASKAPDALITVEQKDMGLDPATTAVIVAFAPVAAKILADVWQYLILPRLRELYGPKAVEPVAAKDKK